MDDNPDEPGETDVTSTHSPVTFYASSRCPYSQRVWIGLEEKEVEYNWVEIDLYRKNDTESENDQRRWLLPLEELRQRYPGFVSCSPRGQLPAVENGGDQLCDTSVLLEYIHEVFSGPPLLPTAPYSRAQVRFWSKHVDQAIVPNYDRLLAAHDPEARTLARDDLLRALADFEAAMAPLREGPFFLGDDFSLADLNLAPWWLRMCSVLRAYRKFDPSPFSRLQAWYEAVEARPSFARTAVDPEKLIEELSYCADPEIEEGTRFRRSSLKSGRGRLIGGRTR
eukprot:TRINITY_DN84502_c0_g1_i1.p1 TRINITY_DN84502_c0_g1~~TRINITY_DN84502_c0_g1_i1.p1  ORF type:complete len:281 (-),score=36.27 TRINITY_DN84502_c0_g1_i1:88-930(-)